MTLLAKIPRVRAIFSRSQNEKTISALRGEGRGLDHARRRPRTKSQRKWKIDSSAALAADSSLRIPRDTEAIAGVDKVRNKVAALRRAAVDWGDAPDATTQQTLQTSLRSCGVCKWT